VSLILDDRRWWWSVVVVRLAVGDHGRVG